MVNSMTLFLNQADGSDDNDGETIDKPLKTLDQALRIASGRTWKLTIKCLSNITLKKVHGFNHDLTLVGIDSTGKATERQITSIGEAENSPVADGGRFFGSLHSNAGVMIFLQYFTIKLPSAVNTSINYPSMFITGSSIALRFSNCHFDGSAARAGTFFMYVGVRSDLSFYRTTFESHLGRMVQGYTNTAGTNTSDIKKLFTSIGKV